MPNHDCVLIDPAPTALERALRESADAANAGARERRLDWPLTTLTDVLAQAGTAAEGWHQWNGGTGRGRSGEARSVVVLAWWTDRIGRKHHRIVGRRGPFNNASRRNLLAPGDDRPALWLVYPERVFLCQRGAQWEMIAVCDCGSVGTPEALGWLGPCCGPCHDRREAGDAPLPVWDGPPCTTLPGQRSQPAALCFSPDGERLLIRGMWSSAVRAWSVTTRRLEEWQLGDVYTFDMVLGEDEPVAVIWRQGTVVLLEVVSQEEHLLSTNGIGQTITGAAFSPDGSTLACAMAHSDEIVLWDVRAATRRAALRAPGLMANLLAFSPDGQALAAASSHGSVRQWSVSSGQEGAVLYGAPNVPQALAYSPDRQLFAAGCQDGSVWWWDTATGASRPPLPRHAPGRTVVAFSPDGRTLATAGSDGTVRFWDVAGHRERGAFRWHCGGVQALAFCPKGGWLATIASDDKVKVWPGELLSS
jgi:sugar lactone lactonase YvrE